ncbi:uncharacterized protein TNIN_41761 [Trichonephila inaurata madagascariensis]|uniref:Uncharacterized protein n=1 Tax=Trichonephila inaurata madagascariensis TaxID=2747483 RepID=A0A8X6XJM1_9ARAC|nr:uncharacterized protein TNIN_41761 [Trichonephila inaurata madagascariensis]
MSAVVYYVIPALLGRAYDLKNDSVGPDLFKYEDTQQAKIIERYMTTAEYKVVEELSEASDFLDVSGKLALKLKIGSASLEGSGSYLKETKDLRKKVDLLVKVCYETVTITIPTSVTPMPNWESMVKDSPMTHYVRSITYGGELIATLRFTAQNEEDKETIKALVQGELNSGSGSFGGGLKGGLEKIQEKVGDSAKMDINYYATVPLGEEIPRTFDGLVKLVEEFPAETKKVNNGRGVPLKMEVFSLKGLNRDMKTYYQSLALGEQLAMIDEYFRDVRAAKQGLEDFLKPIPPVSPPEVLSKVGEFNSKLEHIDRIFCEVIANMDLSPEAKADQFKPAFDAYFDGREDAMPGMWVKQLYKIKKEFLDGTKAFETDFGGSHYTYWGDESCPSSAKIVFNGTMSATDRDSIGSSEYTCLPTNREYPSDKTGEDEIEDYPQIQPVAFVSRKAGTEQKQKLVKCANCRVPGKSTTTMLVGTTTCPSGWDVQYQGTLTSTDYEQVRGELICLDTSKSFEDASANAESLTLITEVSPKCGSYPCSNGVSETTALPCIVCSITKKSDTKADFLRI